jgi:hypothetical protein
VSKGTIKSGKAVLVRTGAYYGWTSPSGETFEVYPVGDMPGRGQKWWAVGNKGTKLVRCVLADIRADLPRCK